jgi:hypothetical protein
MGVRQLRDCLASLSKRWRISSDDESCSGRTLMATSRPSRVSRARYTSPIPPAPTGETISYGPSRAPAASVKFPTAYRKLLPGDRLRLLLESLTNLGARRDPVVGP